VYGLRKSKLRYYHNKITNMEINNMEILKGLPVANAINEKLMEQVKSIEGPLPHLAIIRVGERPDDCSYERGAVKKMDKVGVRCTTYTFDADIDNETFQAEFDKINENPDIDGILMLRPLPKQLDEKQIENKIDPRKDLDGISPLNLAKVYAGDESGYAPCTAEAVIEMLDYAGIDIKGKRVTVVGRSLVIGKPVSMLLMKRNATVTVCHTKTVDMEGTCKNAEILVAAAGSARMIKKDYVAEGAIVVDVGINVDEEGNLCGDVDFDAITDIAAIATPVPGGVGSVTTSVLAKHLVKAAMAR
jgi:methylenetetrahydrofolate dehydrogenase (NADP+)/methenyltetrahydrofolate cyclohydrolase